MLLYLEQVLTQHCSKLIQLLLFKIILYSIICLIYPLSHLSKPSSLSIEECGTGTFGEFNAFSILSKSKVKLLSATWYSSLASFFVCSSNQVIFVRHLTNHPFSKNVNNVFVHFQYVLH